MEMIRAECQETDALPNAQAARLALVSTPRSGNTWLRLLLASLFELDQRAAHRPSDVDWERLPDRYIPQLHWGRDESFEATLSRHGFRIVTIARHPMDSMISLPNWVDSGAVPEFTWGQNPYLAGEAGDECPWVGVKPRSSEFLRYASGRRGSTLLAVTGAWWEIGSTLRVCYEELVAGPARELGRLAAVRQLIQV